MRRQKNYLLRLWNDSNDQEMWRATIIDIQTKEQEHLASIKALEKFLHSKLSNIAAKNEKL